MLEPAYFDGMFDLLHDSLSSIANQGLRVCMIVLSIVSVVSIFSATVGEYFRHRAAVREGVKSRKLQREIDKVDRDKNREDIIQDKMDRDELNTVARMKLRHKNPNLLITDKVYDRELQEFANDIFLRRNFRLEVSRANDRRLLKEAADERFEREYADQLVQRRVQQAELQHRATEELREKHPDWEVAERVHQMEVQHEAEQEFHRANPGAFSARRDLYAGLNQQYYAARNASRTPPEGSVDLVPR